MNAALVINKEDMWDDIDRELADALKNLYSSIGYPVFFVSAATGDGLTELTGFISGKISLLAGNSGVGKSSLINALVPDANLKTGEISDIHHTESHHHLLRNDRPPRRKALIDIPGVRGFGTIDFKPEEVGHFFPEIFRFSRECRYSDCKHTGERDVLLFPQ